MAYQSAKFEVAIFSCSRDISRAVTLEMGLVTLTTTPLDRLSLAGWNFLWLIYIPNLKFLTSSITKI